MQFYRALCTLNRTTCRIARERRLLLTAVSQTPCCCDQNNSMIFGMGGGGVMSGLPRNNCGLTLDHNAFVSRTASKLMVCLVHGN